ncbi:RluA family pseudouridine synthase [Lacticaseibacillus sp. GG6-2]
MPEFTLHAQVLSPYVSVTAQLAAWHVPKRYRFWLRQHQAVLVNGTYRHGNEPVTRGETITIHLQAADPTNYALEDTPLAIVYEDDQVLVVNKPAGMKPHPNQPGEAGTLMNAVAAYLAPQPAYITHRLDMATSGLTLIAKDPLTQAIINQQLATKTMARAYTALVAPGIATSGTITTLIGRDPEDKRKRMVRADGDAASTHYRRLHHDADGDRVWLTLATGRTHQLRVHLASIGHPILGDPLYAPENPASRLMLHATTLTWQAPLSTHFHTVTAPAPF